MESKIGNLRINQAEKEQLLSLAQKQEENLPLLTIERNMLTIYSADEIRRRAVCQVTNTQMAGLGSVYDPRMGVIDNDSVCASCHKDNFTCPGHEGYIELNERIYHPLFFENVIKVLNVVCNSCGSLFFTRKQLEDMGLLSVTGLRRLSLMADKVKSIPCLRPPQVEGGPVTQCNPNPIYDITKSKEKFQVIYELKQPKKSKVKQLYQQPIGDVMKILNSISQEDAHLMGFQNDSHPRRFIMEALIVMPPSARPPVYVNGEVKHADITTIYLDIVKKNNILNTNLDEQQRIEEKEKLRFAIAHLINNSDGLYNQGRSNAFKSIHQQIVGKEGLIRKAIMGKNADYSARTVLSPDPSLKFGQIRLPRAWASVLTVPIHVFAYNLNYLNQLLAQGKITYYTKGHGKLQGRRIQLNEKSRPFIKLEIGDKVDRWLQNGDYVAFNRQPTLHRYSIMGYEVVLADENTIGLHLSYTTPHNADFDGDEGNVHGPQDLSVASEFATIMNVKQCIMNEQSNRPIMGVVYDAVTGSYLMTDERTEINANDWFDCLSLLTNADSVPTLEDRAEAKGLMSSDRTKMGSRPGRVLFSALFPVDFYYEKGDVLIVNGILVRGQITKDHIGPAGGSIVQVLWKDYGVDRTVDFLTDCPFIVNRWLQSRGFSIGIDDCIPKDTASQQLLATEIAKARSLVSAMGSKLIDPLEESRRERQIIGYVRAITDIGQKIGKESLGMDNPLSIMSGGIGGGAKGSLANITQIVSSVGQQFTFGARMTQSISGGTRCLPYFPMNDTSIEGRGFCEHSYTQGLTPAEFFNVQSAGREGGTDTAVKTADVGHLGQKLSKATEDLRIAEDYTVRNASGVVFSFAYGDDGMDAMYLETVKTKSGDYASFIDLRRQVNKINASFGFAGYN